MIAPNRNSLGLSILLLAIWYAGTSQSNSAAYLLGFMLFSVALVSLVHCWANLLGLQVEAAPIGPIFAGDPLQVTLLVKSTTQKEHPALRFKIGQGQSRLLEVVGAKQPQTAYLAVPGVGRGYHTELTVRGSTSYPLGFFTATRSFTIKAPHYVYPTPMGERPPPRSIRPTLRNGSGRRSKGDEFAGTRAYQTGESQRHIDWKAAARGQGLLVKQWEGECDDTLRLSWNDVLDLSWEARLCQLAKWITLAERSGASYSLSLPSGDIPPGRESTHFHTCLRALAAFPREVSS